MKQKYLGMFLHYSGVLIKTNLFILINNLSFKIKRRIINSFNYFFEHYIIRIFHYKLDLGQINVYHAVKTVTGGGDEWRKNNAGGGGRI